MRIFALSDIHVDYDENWTWLQELSEHDYTEDILLLAGDVAHSITLLQRALKTLKKCFAEVLFVPGNHDLWVDRRSQSKTSLDKFQTVKEIALDAGLRLDPAQFGSVTVVPLLGWYDYSFGQPGDELQGAWMDYKACRWPDDWEEREITQHFMAMNDHSPSISEGKVVTFSHFLPRVDIMPAAMPAIHKRLFPVLGTSLLEKQVRTLRSHIHVYGHHHLNRRIERDDVVYINNALGYPHETRIASRRLQCILEL
ncbi:MAG: metallophosphoesterase family protein [Chloroflexota bacterium]|nr:metallophosphoesterase family protein [Chloroflexota bacterium]